MNRSIVHPGFRISPCGATVNEPVKIVDIAKADMSVILTDSMLGTFWSAPWGRRNVHRQQLRPSRRAHLPTELRCRKGGVSAASGGAWVRLRSDDRTIGTACRSPACNTTQNAKTLKQPCQLRAPLKLDLLLSDLCFDFGAYFEKVVHLGLADSLLCLIRGDSVVCANRLRSVQKYFFLYAQTEKLGVLG